MAINFTRAFDSSWERMMIILFRPFDLGKWFAIGLGAFLAGLMQGGNGFNSFNQNFQSHPFSGSNSNPATRPKLDWNHLHAQIMTALQNTTTWVIITVSLVIFLAVIVFSLLILWLGSRGQFLLVDNVVRNRGLISGPWNFYARQANSFFALHLLLSFLSFLLLLPILIVAVIVAIPAFQQDRWPHGGEIVGFIALGAAYLVVAIAVTIVLFLFRDWTVPIMFRRGLLARPAFLLTVDLVRRNPGAVSLYLLLRMALAIGLAVVAIVVCLGTCCLGLIPYLGTVLLLPALIFIRCFSLDCLGQINPDFDAFTVDVPPVPVGQGLPPISPPPPLG